MKISIRHMSNRESNKAYKTPWIVCHFSPAMDPAADLISWVCVPFPKLKLFLVIEDLTDRTDDKTVEVLKAIELGQSLLPLEED